MRPEMMKVLLILPLFLLAGSAISASDPDQQEMTPVAADDIENIVVTGQRPEVLRQLMQDFIVEIGNPVSSRGYARWQHRLCIGVYNLPDRTAAQYITDKITIAALEIGLKTGSLGCQPNLHIIFSPDARALADSLVDDSPLMFHPFGHHEATTQGLDALEQFRTSEAPVRWWQITMVVDELGLTALVLPGINDTGSTVDPVTNNFTIPMSRGEVSRLKSGVSDAIMASLIIVDAGKLDNVKYPQLADYLTMVSLAQVDPLAQPTSNDSILNLFNSSSPPRGMTEMDVIYLRALYEMNTMTLPHIQRGAFSHMMVRELNDMKEVK